MLMQTTTTNVVSMISQPEYLANSAQLQTIAEHHRDELINKLRGVSDVGTGINVTNAQAALYHSDFEDVLSTALAQTGNTTVDHYDRVLKLNLPDEAKHEIVAEQIMRQTTDLYYGATLDQRLAGSRRMNAIRIRKSATVGRTLETKLANLSRIFVDPYPHGAQVAVDQRLMLGQLVKLEHDLASRMAGIAEIRVVKWSLSHRHKRKDICDDYAEAIDKAVAAYMRNRGITASPKGCYFIDEVPEPPHPNCQCSLRMLHDGTFTTTVVERAVEFIKDLLGKLNPRRKK